MLSVKQEHQPQQPSDPITILSIDGFVAKCLDFNEFHPELDMKKFEVCPVEVYASQINKPCKTAVSGIRTCPICEKPMCPVCGSHSVTQISRITGYASAISGWNQAKLAELHDRQRYNIGVGGAPSNTKR